MTVPLWYLAAPVGAATADGVADNLKTAGRWLAYLLEREPGAAVIAPWLATMLAGVQDDLNPEHRRRGMRDNLVAAARCDGIVLCGGRISSGMAAELDTVIAAGGRVADLTFLGATPPVPIAILHPGGPLTWGELAWTARMSVGQELPR